MWNSHLEKKKKLDFMWHDVLFFVCVKKQTITCENVQFARDISNALSYIFVTTFLPDSNNLAPVQIDSVHLSDEDGGHGLIKRCAVHVDCGTDWEDETRYSLVDAQVLFQASEGDRQGTSTAVGGGIKKTGRYILLSLVT